MHGRSLSAATHAHARHRNLRDGARLLSLAPLQFARPPRERLASVTLRLREVGRREPARAPGANALAPHRSRRLHPASMRPRSDSRKNAGSCRGYRRAPARPTSLPGRARARDVVVGVSHLRILGQPTSHRNKPRLGRGHREGQIELLLPPERHLGFPSSREEPCGAPTVSAFVCVLRGERAREGERRNPMRNVQSAESEV